MCLFDPTKGTYEVDGQAITSQNKYLTNCISHVPQNIFLIDSTI